MTKRTRKWLKIAGAVVAAIVVICVAAVLVVRSKAFHRFVLSQIVTRAEKATGSKVAIADFTFDWSKLRLGFDDIVIQGAEPPGVQPLLAVSHASVTIKIISLLERKFELASLVIDHPVVHLVVNAAGETNIPHPPSKPGEKPFDVFSLAVRRFTLQQGEIDYNDRKIPLEAHLDGLDAKAFYSAHPSAYSGAISYREGLVRIGTFRPVQHSLDASFRATESGLDVPRLTIDLPNSRFSARASVRNYERPFVEGSYTATVSLADVSHLLKETDLPAGDVHLAGSFHFQSAPGRSILESITAEGRASSSKLAFNLPQMQAALTDFSADYQVHNGQIEASELRARAFGGLLRGRLDLLDFAGQPKGRLAISASDISLARVQAALRAKPPAGLAIEGELAGTAEASWSGALKELRIASTATISAANTPPAARPGEVRIPVNGAIQLAYADGNVTLNHTVLRTAASQIDLNGTVGSRSALQIDANTSSLAEIDSLAAEVRRALATGGASPAQPFGIAGTASFHGIMQGAIESPALSGQLTANNLELHGTPIGQLHAEVSLSPYEASVRQGMIMMEGGRLRFSGSVALHEWSFTPSNPITLTLLAASLPLANLERVAGQNWPVSGLLSGQISMSGSVLRPTGEGSISLSHLVAWNQPVESVEAHFQSHGTSVQARVTANAAGGVAKADIDFTPKDRGYSAQVEIDGIRLSELEIAKARKLRIHGVLKGTAQGAGTLSAPEVAANLEIAQLNVGGEAVPSFAAHARLVNRRATVAVEASVAGAPVKLGGTVELSDSDEANLTFSAGLTPLEPLLVKYLPHGVKGVRGEIELSGWIRGPLRDPAAIQAHIDVPRLSVSYEALTLANAAPIAAEYGNGVLTLQPSNFKGNGTDLTLQARIPIESSAPLSASATGTLDLRTVQLFYPQWNSSGEALIDATISGSRSHPEVKGQIRVVNGAIAPPDSPLTLDKINGVIGLTADRATIQSLSAEAGGGSISASGFVDFRQGGHFSLGLNARGVRVRYPPGVREVVDGNLAMTGSLASSLISGQVEIDQLAFTQSFDLAAFASQFGAPSAPTPTTSFLNRVNLNVALRSSRELALRSNELSLRGAADLRVRGTLADPVILGRATLASGQLFFNGRRYRIENGVVQFSNPVQTEPVLDVRVTTTVNQYDLSVNFVGPLDRMRTTYTSNPPLPPLDILHLLLTGQPVEAPSTGFSAQSLLAQGLAGQVSSRVQKLVGVSSLTIDPQMGGHGSNPGARIAVQEQVTRKLYFTFSVDVATAQDDVVQVDYQLSHRLSLQAIRDQSGGYSVEIRVRKEF